MLIYNDSIEFNFLEKGHKYTVSKKVGEAWTTLKPVTGVTTITGIINKEALVPWASKLSAEYMRDNWKKAESIPALAEEARRQPQMAAQRGKDAGSIGHAMVEALLQDKEVIMPKDKEKLAMATSIRDAFEKWREDFKPVVKEVEVPFYSIKFDYAGKFDLLCEINGKLTLIDFKTTNPSYYNPDGIYAENFAQLGAYTLGYEEMAEVEIEDLMIVNIPKDGSEYKIKSLSDLGLSKTDAELYFLNCLGLYELHRQFSWKLK